MVFFAGLNKAGYRYRTHCMAGHSNTRCLLIMKSMQSASLAQALGSGTPVRRHNTIGSVSHDVM